MVITVNVSRSAGQILLGIKIMDKALKKKWVSALRSGKYKQGKDRLRQTNTHGETVFCCLGVLCEIQDNVVWSSQDHHYRKIQTYPSIIGVDKVSVPGGPPMSHARVIAERNDAGVSFQEIADSIEAQEAF